MDRTRGRFESLNISPTEPVFSLVDKGGTNALEELLWFWQEKRFFCKTFGDLVLDMEACRAVSEDLVIQTKKTVR